MSATEMAVEAMDLALAHVDEGVMASSARSTLDDAVRLHARGEHGWAAKRAADSLAYSVGVFHTDHARATAIASELAGLR